MNLLYGPMKEDVVVTSREALDRIYENGNEEQNIEVSKPAFVNMAKEIFAFMKAVVKRIYQKYLRS